MKTDAIVVGKVLSDNCKFAVPIYQRQYAWNENRLQPFWEDVVSKSEELLAGPPKFQHYMGALILAPGSDGYIVGRVSSVQVVDGQQRLTTFQLFLAALRYIALKQNYEAISKALDVYIFNDQRVQEDNTSNADRLRLIPTPSDRNIFRALMTDPFEAVQKQNANMFHKNGSVISSRAPKSLLAYLYFRYKIQEYAKVGNRIFDEDDLLLFDPQPDGRAGQRLQALADALLSHFKLVVISLDEKDDAQVIFETLNSRGEPLLAMDLVRNNIFHRAESQGELSENLFETRWKPLTSPFWKEDAPRAKPKRPRIDHFLSYSLTAQTGQETSLRELYAEYRSFARPKGEPRFATVEEELDALLQFSDVYKALETYEGDTDLSWLGQKLTVWEVASAYPLVFAVAVSAIESIEKKKIYHLIYSYIVRRSVCGLTAKNLNKNFIRIVSVLRQNGTSVETFCNCFITQTGPTVRFPTDAEFVNAITNEEIYKTILRSDRLIDIFWELEKTIRSKFQVDQKRPDFLSIEHIMPQNWQTHWPIVFFNANGLTMSDDEKTGAVQNRQSHLHRMGNLTLVTTPLNSSMQNQSFDLKKGRLRDSLLSLNNLVAEKQEWNEHIIAARGAELAELAVKTWPFPSM